MSMFDTEDSPFRQLYTAADSLELALKLDEIFTRLGIETPPSEHIKAIRKRTFSRDGTFTYVVVGDPVTRKVFVFVSGKQLNRPVRVTKPRKDILYELPELQLHPRWYGLLGYSIIRT